MGQPHPRQPAGNRRSRQPEAGRDPLTRQPVLAAQLGRQSNPERTRRRLGRMGLGRVVLQPGFSIAPPARQPFAGGSFADPEARCHFADRPPPPTIRRIISARPSGVVRAFLCGLFVLVPCGASCRNDHLQALTGDEQPPQTPQLPAKYVKVGYEVLPSRIRMIQGVGYLGRTIGRDYPTLMVAIPAEIREWPQHIFLSLPPA